MSSYRVGIVGYGMIAHIHAAAVMAVPDATLVGVMDRGSGHVKLPPASIIEGASRWRRLSAATISTS